MNVYENCPVLENESFLLRIVDKQDCAELLKVYSDHEAVPLFNSDNCNGDDFFYETADRMERAIDFWIFSYRHRYFVRWSIIDRKSGEAIGTIELFRRDSEDAFTNTGLLRLDLRSDYEQADAIESILSLIIEPAYELFDCISISTKAVPQAAVRRAVLVKMGFEESMDALTGHDGTQYGSYFVRRKYA